MFIAQQNTGKKMIKKFEFFNSTYFSFFKSFFGKWDVMS